MQQKKFNLVLPKNQQADEVILSDAPICIIGANGSGKTRLGTWIDITSAQSKLVHRISAQKSLAMPDTTTPVSIDKAERNLLWGYSDAAQGNEQNYKIGHKWGGKPSTQMLGDFEKLLVYLFSSETEENANYKRLAIASAEKIDPPKTKLDMLKAAWEKVLPHRELIMGGLRVQTKVKGKADSIYKSSDMSDGERVIFYLIGQCLAAVKDGIIVIDEPELHLHKSIQSILWAEIERLRKDCLFVYITHDVDFAADQVGATKVWLKAFDGTNWDWEVLREDDGLPSDLLLEIVGSRRPVAFVEGTVGSHDVALYRALLPNFLVIPRGSCTQVILSVKALKANQQLHHLEVYGLIDRDRRVPAEINQLEQDSIFVLGVAEVENLFCVPQLVALISERLARDPVADLDLVTKGIFRRVREELENQVSLRAAAEIRHKLKMFDDNRKGEAGLKSALLDLVNGIDTQAIYAASQAEFDAVLDTEDFPGLLRIYNRKSLASQAGVALGLGGGQLPELVLRLVKGDSRSAVAKALAPYFGNFGERLKAIAAQNSADVSQSPGPGRPCTSAPPVRP